MAKFQYRMQNILDIKEKLEGQEKINFSIAMQHLNEEQEALQKLMIRRASYERDLKELSLGSLNIADINSCKKSIDSMKRLIRDQMMNVKKAQRDVDIARARLNSVMQERKMHENLKEKDFEEFKEELEAAESKITDELVSYTYHEKDE